MTRIFPANMMEKSKSNAEGRVNHGQTAEDIKDCDMAPLA